MKFILAPVFATLFAAIPSASAQLFQGAFITAPSAGTNIASGKNFTVSLRSQIQPTDFDQVLLIISMKGCEIDPCDSYVDNVLLGTDVLYSGPYNPTLLPTPPGGIGENFTVTAPQYGNGPAIVFVTHQFTLGAIKEPFVEFLNTTVNIVNGPF